MDKATELTQDAIKAAILQHLPAHVGEVLQAELLALKNERAAHASTKERLLTETTARKQLATALVDIDQREKGAQKILEREAAVAERENKQTLRDLEVKLSDLRRQDAVDMVKLVFRSPMFTRSISGTVPIAVDGMPPSQYGGGTSGMVLAGHTATTETVSQG